MTLETAMMSQTGSCHRFLFLFLLCTLHLSPTLAYVLKDCTILYSDNVTAGVSVNCTNRHLVNIPDDIPRDVASLTLSYNSIAHVDDGAFVNLVGLKVLYMDSNKLTHLTDNAFQGLSKLLLLNLDNNHIQSISPATFRPLTSLQELNLMSTQINPMRDIITILQLPHLHVLNITAHYLASFQSNNLQLNMSSELRELRVKSTLEKFSITTTVFPHLETIDLLDCCNDGWEWDIPDDYFLKNKTNVYFRYDYFGDSLAFKTIAKTLSSVENNVSETAVAVVDNIEDIEQSLNIACQIPTLRTLKILENRELRLLKQPHLQPVKDKLSPCTQLTNMDLSDNALDMTQLTKYSINQMKKLSHLNLNRNRLSKVPDDVKNLPMLHILDLNDNDINDLSCSDFLNLTQLTHLHLDNNGLFEFKWCVFQPLNELKTLTLKDNYIHRFDGTFNMGLQKIGGLQKLAFLDLNGNSFTEFNEGDFGYLKSLKHLYVGSDKLKYWDTDPFKGFDELETLSLILNVVDNREEYPFSGDQDLPLLKSLKNLTIQFNIERDCTVWISSPITQRTFANTPQLKTLHLKNNNLPILHCDEWDGRLDMIPNLEVLDLSNNKMKSLDFLANNNLTQLSWLDLSQNELTTINVSVLHSLPALRYIIMGDNPFACDCSNSDFHQWVLNNNQAQVVGARDYTCGYPLAKKGARFLDFDVHSCDHIEASFICFISSTCVIVLTLLTSFTYHFLRLHLLYAYYLFLAFLYDSNKTNKRRRGAPQKYDAFISFNVHDELWVCKEMLPMLEGEQGWKLCLHHRDFLPGKPIVENIADAIYGSRKTICVISHHYLESEWCSREFQMASYRLFDERKDILILVFLEDIPAHQLSPYYHMRRLVKRHTYLSWSQSEQQPGLFWQNLRRALDTPQTDLHMDI